VLRLLHLVVIAGLVSAAAYVYKIKFDATVQAEQVAKVRRDIRRERDAIALLRAEWAKLDNPIRVQDLTCIRSRRRSSTTSTGCRRVHRKSFPPMPRMRSRR
jgi:hypothetical protein